MMFGGIRNAMLALAAILSCLGDANAQSAQWIGAWGASPSGLTVWTFQGFTLRQTVHVGAGGSQYRLRLSNELSGSPVTLTSVMASAAGNAPGWINTAFSLPVLFGGQSTITIPPYASVLSDPVPGVLTALSDFVVSFYVASGAANQTMHATSSAIGYSAPGNQAASVSLSNQSVLPWRVALSEVDSLQPAGRGTIATIGDSITDGYQSTVNANHRWPDYLAARLQMSGTYATLGVVNEGISSGALLFDNGILSSALSRISRDVLAVPNLRYVIVLLGINDIAIAAATGQPLAAADLIQGYQQIIAKAHEVNVKVLMGTILPVSGNSTYSQAEETIRGQVNTWIRSGKGFDGVLDFDKALRDPSMPARLLFTYDSGDHIHPSDSGYAAMAAAIPLNLFAP